ncbi:MAG TPA: phosphate ABC transporter permease PstA [Acidimicrobiales bacterium]|nr:phosphate ABC transporter permease PstA [Acidimicrobiales bacterium]
MTVTAPPAPGAEEFTEPIGVRRRLVRQRARRSLVRRRLVSRGAVVVCALALAASLAPLVGLVAYTVGRGWHVLSGAFLTHEPTPPGVPGGGIANAIVGSVVLVALGAAMAVPVGVAAALFLLERRGRIAGALRFGADVLTGVPSIAIGIVAYGLLIAPGGLLSLGHYSGLSGSVALAVLMLPIVVRASESAMAAVPSELREAGLALGVRRSRVMRSVVLRSALPGLVTGNLLAVARAVGETAPLLFTAIGSQLFALNPLQPVAAMPLVIYNDGTQPFPAAQQIAWGTALVLLALVLVLSVAARAVAAFLNRRAR